MRVCSSIAVGRSVGWKIKIIEYGNSSYTSRGTRIGIELLSNHSF